MGVPRKVTTTYAEFDRFWNEVLGDAWCLTDLDGAIKAIRAGLKTRSGKAWSVKRGSGTAYGWITITVPPARCVGGRVTEADARDLAGLLGLARADDITRATASWTQV